MRVSTINYLALAVFLITAYFSFGHNQSDEHYQILEFAQYQLGHIDGSELPWEFEEKMRPSIQPWTAVVLIKFLGGLGINDPFVLTGLFRVLSALLLWGVMVKLNQLLIKQYFPEPDWAVIFSAFTLLLWYVPFISVRFSSENYSALFLLSGLYFMLRDQQKKWDMLAVGCCFGLSFLFRYQMGLAIAGALAYLLFIQKTSIRSVLEIALAALLVIIFGTYLDYLFYGELVVAPYNYLKLNLVEGRASDFGVDPPWYYLTQFFIAAVPPISLVLLISFGIGAYHLKKHAYLWSFIPFLLIHSLIAHKEIRFMFPVNYLFLFLSVYGLKAYFLKQEIKRWHRGLFRFLLGVNALLLLVMIIRPANETVVFCKYLYRNIDDGNRVVVSTGGTYYKLIGELQSTFYTPDETRTYATDSVNQISSLLIKNGIDTCFYVHRGFALTDKIEGYRAALAYSLYPDFIRSTSLVKPNKIKTHAIYLLTKE
jgi:phosphatidylinositol glycan class B